MTKTLPVDFSAIQKRNLTQKSNLQKNHFYSIFRNSAYLQKSDLFSINDITSTEFQFIDSLEKLFNFQKELIGFSNDKNYSVWKFLTKWPSLTVDQKNKKYNKHMCHEFNLFLYFKDQAYF